MLRFIKREIHKIKPTAIFYTNEECVSLPSVRGGISADTFELFVVDSDGKGFMSHGVDIGDIMFLLPASRRTDFEFVFASAWTSQRTVNLSRASVLTEHFLSAQVAFITEAGHPCHIFSLARGETPSRVLFILLPASCRAEAPHSKR